ncbi:hypothetical protein DFH28DRAFT_91287 [Melampsora americana]|nr:hypothetical protein DFH28DRAFT_91287 [Melampsora americana]
MAQAPVERKSIFVGNIPTDIAPEQLQAAFQPFGVITDLHIPPDTQTRTNRNFAFITFSDTSSAVDAIDNMHLNTLPSHPLKILKVNLARANNKSGGSAGAGQWGSKKAIWDDEQWIKEHALKDVTTEEEPPTVEPV